MANARTSNAKSSDWSRSAEDDQGDEAATRASMARAATDKSSGSSRSGSQTRSQSSGSNFTASALRSMGQYYDMQAATARAMLRAQSRAASVFGLPDYSRIFEIGDERALRFYSSATENLVSFANHSDISFTQIPSQLFRIFERQAIDMTERWKDRLEELQQQTTESMSELKDLARQQTEELARSATSISKAAQSTMREGGEQFRSAVSQGREMAGQQAQALGQQAKALGRESKHAAEEIEEGAEQAMQAARQEGRSKAADENADQGTSRSRHGRAA